MVLIEQWKKSLKLLLDKQFWLINLKTFIECFPLTLKRTWFLLPVWFVVTYGLPSFVGIPHNTLMMISEILLWIVTNTMVFYYYLTIRSSVTIKDSNYYKRYFLYYIIFLITSALISLSVISLHYGYLPSFLHKLREPLSYIIAYYVGNLFLEYFLSFFTFFFLDSKLSLGNYLKACLNALKLYIYVFPVCLFMLVITTLTKNALFLIGMPAIRWLVFIFIFFILKFIKITIAHTLYIRQTHENPESYKR